MRLHYEVKHPLHRVLYLLPSDPDLAADFLRLSRHTVDDTIAQNLNALLTPSSTHFDPTSTSRTIARPSARRKIPADTCSSFRAQVLFPSWRSRSDVLAYCAAVATSPDPDDPELLVREVEDAKASERIIDERLDPYSARYFPREARTESLAALIRNERMVEKIVRERTWGVLGDKCDDVDGTADQAFETWSRGVVR